MIYVADVYDPMSEDTICTKLAFIGLYQCERLTLSKQGRRKEMAALTRHDL